MSNANTISERAEGESTTDQSEGGSVPITRRNMIISGAAVGATTFGLSAPASASGEIGLDLESGYGGNPNSTPESIHLDPGTSFTFDLPDEYDGDALRLVVEIDPSSGDYQEIGSHIFEGDSSGDQTIVVGQFTGGVDFFAHSDFNPSDLEVTDDAEALTEFKNRFGYREIGIRVRLLSQRRNELSNGPAPGRASIDTFFVKTGGLGVNLGYAMSEFPLKDVREDPDADDWAAEYGFDGGEDKLQAIEAIGWEDWYDQFEAAFE